MGYWDATDLVLQANGGQGPPCPACGKPMYPIDDHGRFQCTCGGDDFLGSILGRRGGFLQVPVKTKLSNAEKSQIAPINRLDHAPTTAEAKMLELMVQGPDAMDSPEYWEASRAVDEERRQAGR